MFCHKLNSIIQTSLSKTCDTNTDFQTIYSSCIEIVLFVRKTTGIQNTLSVKLKLGGKTRPWRAFIEMFESIKINSSESSTLNSALITK